jgi:carbon monoxide dehydrogenase subunit G
MRIEDSFEVPASVQEVWDHLLDVERVVPCMPGAELTETIDESTWKGTVTLRLGAVSMSFAGTVSLQEADEEARRLVLRAEASEKRGRGGAGATITSILDGDGDKTTVQIIQDVDVTGQVAQFGRGLLQDVSSELTGRFAECLRTNIEAGEAVAVAGAARGLSLALNFLRSRMIRVLGGPRRAIGRFLQRLIRVLDDIWGAS